jgi:hypothetical protein
MWRDLAIEGYLVCISPIIDLAHDAAIAKPGAIFHDNFHLHVSHGNVRIVIDCGRHANALVGGNLVYGNCGDHVATQAFREAIRTFLTLNPVPLGTEISHHELIYGKGWWRNGCRAGGQRSRIPPLSSFQSKGLLGLSRSLISAATAGTAKLAAARAAITSFFILQL